MTVIVRQALAYAVQKNILAENPFSRVSIDRKLFRSDKKPNDETQVFLTDEQPLIEREAYRDFQEAGDRLVYLSSTARNILELVMQSNRERGFQDHGYLFLNANGRIHGRSVETRIRKYCRNIGIDEKSSHKARKTYISSLIDAGVNINEIRKQVGHEDERTTYRNYCFNRMPQSETENMLEKVLTHKTE